MRIAPRRSGWRTSSYCDNGADCVDVDFTEVGVEIRHSRYPDGPVISFDGQQWDRWLAEVVHNQIDNTNGAVTVTVEPDTWIVRSSTATLRFTPSEWTAFRLGATAGEFDRRATVTPATH